MASKYNDKDEAAGWWPCGIQLLTRSKPYRKKKGKASRAISIARLNASLRLHLRPIDVIVYDGPSGGCPRET